MPREDGVRIFRIRTTDGATYEVGAYEAELRLAVSERSIIPATVIGVDDMWVSVNGAHVVSFWCDDD